MARCSCLRLCKQLWMWLGCSGFIMILLASAGCAGRSPGKAVLCTCRVTVDGQVLHDVHVVLYQEGSSQPLLEGTSDGTGTVGLVLVEGAAMPAETSVKLRATVESVGDWQVIAPWSSKENSPLRVDYSGGTETLQLELPTKALKAL